MGTLTGSLFAKQMAIDWFSDMTDQQRTEMLKKHNIDKTVEDGTLTNGEVIEMHRVEILEPIK